MHAKSLDGTDFIPGCVGLNNIGKNSDYMNVILQLFTSIVPIRNFLLEYNAPDRNTKQFDPVLASLSSMAKKIYNVKNFKGIVSPHEFFQAVGRASGKRFYGTQQDPVALFSWLVSWLKKKMKKATPSLDLLKIFEGEVSVKNSETDMTGWTETFHPCVIFQLDLPDAPLFRVASDFIPQVGGQAQDFSEKVLLSFIVVDSCTTGLVWSKFASYGRARTSKRFWNVALNL